MFSLLFPAYLSSGVIAMSWCPIDSSYLLTCAKDNRTICWDIVSGEVEYDVDGSNVSAVYLVVLRHSDK